MILHFDHFDSSRGLISRFVKYNINVVYLFLVRIQINVHNNFCWLNIISCTVIISFITVNFTHFSDYAISDDVISCKIFCISL